MFTGIVQGLGTINATAKNQEPAQIDIAFPDDFLPNLITGASVAIDGACLTVTAIQKNVISFHVIPETIRCTNLGHHQPGDLVNIERAARFGDEIGGHMLSGHIFGTATVHTVPSSENQYKMTVQIPLQWIKYFYPKGYIALDGVSLTIIEAEPTGLVSVGLIPETLQRTTLGKKEMGSAINVEIDSLTQTVVDTVERMMKEHYSPHDYPCEPIY